VVAAVPVPNPGMPPYVGGVSISAGVFTSLIRAGGSVSVWGANFGNVTPAIGSKYGYTPIPLPGVHDVSAAALCASGLLLGPSRSPSQVTLASSKNPSWVGDDITFTATVTGTSGYSPSGQVGFYQGDDPFPSTVDLNQNTGQASNITFWQWFLAGQDNRVYATYGGDFNNAPATSDILWQHMNKLNSATTFTVSPNPADQGKDVIFTVTVNSQANGPVPTGSVSFTNGIFGSNSLVNGQFQLTSNPSFPVGTTSLTAYYSGDQYYNPSQSAPVDLVIQQPVIPPAFFEATVTGPGWIDAGIDINTGDQVTITASGELFFDVIAPPASPDGFGMVPPPFAPAAPDILGLPYFSLIGHIGTNIADGLAFPVGSNLTFVAASSGRLALEPNVVSFEPLGGIWNVTISVNGGSGGGKLIQDPNLEAAIITQIGQSPGYELTLNDLQNLNSLYAIGQGIQSLAGMENCINIADLELSYNQIQDLSPLSHLTSLSILNLGNNSISNIASLSSLVNLSSLNLDYNQVTDINPLSSIHSLQSLSFQQNQIQDVSVLTSLTDVRSIYLGSNHITTLPDLSALSHLEVLSVIWNQITRIPDVSGLPSLYSLDIGGNPLTEFSALPALHQLQYLTLYSCNLNNDKLANLSGLNHLIYVELGNNQITSLSAISGLTNLTQLFIYYNQLTNLDALASLKNLSYVYAIHNNINDLSGLVANAGFRNGDQVFLANNNLDTTSGSQNMQDIRVLLERGVRVNIGQLIGYTNLTISKNAPSSHDAGSTFTYSLYYSNNGDTAAQNVRITDSLPAGLDFVSASSSGIFNNTAHTVTWNLGQVTAQTKGSVTLTVKIGASLAVGDVVTNSANIQSDTSEPNTSDNTAQTQTIITTSNLPTGVGIDPVTSGGQNISVNWQTPVTFSYDSDSTVTGIDIKVHSVDNLWSDVNGSMTKSSGNHWIYAHTFYPNHGAAAVTYTLHHGSNPDTSVNFNIYIDPAGYIYDSVTGNRISGANVWLQWPNGSGGWTNVPTGLTPAVMQPDTNPLTTGTDGQYQWNTLAGTYRVHVEAPGYLPNDSIAVIVTAGHPVTDLHVGLTPVAPAAAQTWYLDGQDHAEVSGMKLMEKTGTQTGSVTMSSIESIHWLSNVPAAGKVAFNPGIWKVHLQTADLNNMEIHIGLWNPGAALDNFTAFTTSAGQINGGSFYVTLPSVEVPDGQYLALEVSKSSGSPVVDCASGVSYLTSPQSKPDYPVPDAASGILLALGLGGLVLWVISRKRNWLKSSI
jgi:uncharacterized repeat protein (TIGR01451 family)